MMLSPQKLIPIAGICIILFSCSSNPKESSSHLKTSIDTAYEIKAQYAANLTDLSDNKNIDTLLCQGWMLDEDLENLSVSSQEEGILPFRSFYLSADATFIMNPRNMLEYGHWKFDETSKVITLLKSNGGKTEYKLGALTPKELIVVNVGEANNIKQHFIAPAKRYNDVSKDPYHISNNQWRVSPQKQETDEEIRKRLKSFLNFHLLFYRDNLANDEKTISFYGFPTCIKWYAGGIFIIKEKDLSENWIKCFYNKGQAQKARAIMEEVIGKKYQWKKGNISWVIKNLNVLEQMYEKI